MKTPRWQTANVVATAGDRRLLWQFKRAGARAELQAEQTLATTSPLPGPAVARTARDLWQPRLNIAWLPSSQAFVRVVQLPPCEPAEAAAMIEFQLERLSPLPVAQVVWATQPLETTDKHSRTVIVLMAARTYVEQYLGELEGVGYLPDRLELPFLPELLAAHPDHDAVWAYARREAGRILCLVGWWGAGRLAHLNLFQLPGDLSAGSFLVDMLRQTAWAGEMEGWLPPNPRWYLVADAVLAAEVLAPLTDWLGAAPTVRAPLPPTELAACSAAAVAPANLLPAEHAIRYRQQFVDRLWMRGLGALGTLYLFVVLAFFGALRYLDFQRDRVDSDLAALSGSYTNALQLKAKVAVLQEQVNLRFAALDCWKAVSETLPQGLTLKQLLFQRGKKLGLSGIVNADEQTKVTEFNEALSKATIENTPVFGQVSTKSIQGGGGPGNQIMNWSIECDVKRTDM